MTTDRQRMLEIRDKCQALASMSFGSPWFIAEVEEIGKMLRTETVRVGCGCVEECYQGPPFKDCPIARNLETQLLAAILAWAATPDSVIIAATKRKAVRK